MIDADHYQMLIYQKPDKFISYQKHDLGGYSLNLEITSIFEITTNHSEEGIAILSTEGAS